MEKFGGSAAILALLLSFSALQHPAIANDKLIFCGIVRRYLIACGGYITGREKEPPHLCCAGAQRLAEMAKTGTDKRILCECIKKGGEFVHDFDYDRVSDIPKHCDFDIDMPDIHEDTDCSKVDDFEIKSLH